MNWDDLRVFAVLSEAGSLGKTAKALCVDHSTVSRRLAALEAAVGTQLAIRNPSGLELTPAGEAMACTGCAVRDLIDEVRMRVGGEDARAEGLVRVSTTPGFAQFILRGLSRLRREHPGIQVEVLPRAAALDLRRREADIAVRHFRDQTASLITRKVGALGWSLYASEEYLASRDVSFGSASLKGHDVVGYHEDMSGMPGAKWIREHLDGQTPVMTCGDPTTALGAVIAGIGVGVVPCYMAEGQPKMRRLTADVFGFTELFLVTPPDHKNTTRVRLTADLIADYLASKRDLLEGRLSESPECAT